MTSFVTFISKKRMHGAAGNSFLLNRSIVVFRFLLVFLSSFSYTVIASLSQGRYGLCRKGFDNPEYDDFRDVASLSNSLGVFQTAFCQLGTIEWDQYLLVHFN